ncbi:hypothetical protein RchiOBHm_Chr6g0285251 [Rosa chinensis]|uniref:Uncharacterized protein n=1 Tax=Rosa chinensis TaxID=74649 RepID=A0A2P6PUM1_ROSCH|nr:hypothetical protein RchiOBHm_Chr6g0285251 [Rosa chinensis]
MLALMRRRYATMFCMHSGPWCFDNTKAVVVVAYDIELFGNLTRWPGRSIGATLRSVLMVDRFNVLLKCLVVMVPLILMYQAWCGVFGILNLHNEWSHGGDRVSHLATRR